MLAYDVIFWVLLVMSIGSIIGTAKAGGLPAFMFLVNTVIYIVLFVVTFGKKAAVMSFLQAIGFS